MLNLINLQQKPLTTSELRRTLPRGGVDVDAVLPTVTPVVTAIRDHGVSAALDYGEQFDHVRPESLQVPSTVIDQAVADLDPDLRAALEESIARVRAVHADQKPQPHTTDLTTGGTVTELKDDTDAMQREFYAFYRTKRGEFTPKGADPKHTTMPTLSSNVKFANFYPLSDLDRIAPRPLLFITGDAAQSKIFSEMAYQAAGEPKDLYYVKGASHTDMYDNADKIPFAKLVEFYRAQLQ